MGNPEEWQWKASILLVCALGAAASFVGCALKLRIRAPRLMLLTPGNQVLLKGTCPPHSKSCTPLEPTDTGQYADRRYSNYRQSGFVNLDSDMRLRIVSPIMRPGSTEAVTSGAAATDAAQNSPITAYLSKDVLGYETATYTLQPGGRQSVSVDLDSVQVRPTGNSTEQQLPRTDYLKGVPQNVYLRLYFQLRHSGGDHSIVLLQGASQGQLNEASGAFEEAPGKFCAAPEPSSVRCVTFPRLAAVNAEIKVKLKKKFVYVPLGGTVADALAAYGVDDPKQIARKLKITRLWQLNRVPIKFDRDSTAVLQVVVIGGDRIKW